MPRTTTVLVTCAVLALWGASGCGGTAAGNDAPGTDIVETGAEVAAPDGLADEALDAVADGRDASDGGDASDEGDPGAETFETAPEDSGEAEVAPLPPFPDALRGDCPPETRLGGFVVEDYDDYAMVAGQVLDGVVPVTVPIEEAHEGDCRLLRRQNPLCEPPCATDQACGLDGICVPYPAPLALGAVGITGLAKAVSMQPKAPGQNYFDTALPHPAFGAGDEIRLLSEGGALPPLALFGYGVDALDPADASWVLTAGQPLDVSWDAGTADAAARILLRVNVDQHGVSPISLVCDWADTGHAQVPASLIDALLAAGISGFPSGKLVRRTADSVTLPEGRSPGEGGLVRRSFSEGGLVHRSLGEGGCVDLVIATPRTIDTHVAGSTPCTKPADCPPGQSCDTVMQICH